MLQLSQTNPQFLGRLCNILQGTKGQASYLIAANAALAEACHLPTTMVVKDRASAYSAVNAFQASKAGSINCKILDELVTPSPQDLLAADGRIQLPDGSFGIALEAVVGADPQRFSPADLHRHQCLVHGLLSGWAVVKDREAATRIISAQRSGVDPRWNNKRGRMRPWNLVTLAGEVFKADGEIVVPRARQMAGSSSSVELGLYTLTHEARPIGSEHEKSVDPMAAAAASDELMRAKAAAISARAHVQRLDCAVGIAESELGDMTERLGRQKAAASSASRALTLARAKMQTIVNVQADRSKEFNLEEVISAARQKAALLQGELSGLQDTIAQAVASVRELETSCNQIRRRIAIEGGHNPAHYQQMKEELHQASASVAKVGWQRVLVIDRRFCLAGHLRLFAKMYRWSLKKTYFH
jgi:chromosome segregation ATPase